MVETTVVHADCRRTWDPTKEVRRLGMSKPYNLKSKPLSVAWAENLFGEDIPRSETQRPLVGPRQLK